MRFNFSTEDGASGNVFLERFWAKKLREDPEGVKRIQNSLRELHRAQLAALKRLRKHLRDRKMQGI